MPSSTTIHYLARPGRTLTQTACDRLVAELRVVATTCFDDLPEYQVLSGDREVLDHAILALARRDDGSLAGFCAARLLPVPHVGDVFHLGLTCVHPDDRGTGLTHKLLSHVISRYLLTERPLRGAWFSNVASVLSSLGNVAMHFEAVHPSPFRSEPPTATHLAIARAIAAEHRQRLHLSGDAPFCEGRFVFEGGNAGSVFQKDGGDRRYHHRDEELTRWYGELADLDRGDAVLQVGRIHVAGLLKYVARSVTLKIPVVRGVVSERPMLPVLTPQGL